MSRTSDPTRRYIIIGILAIAWVMSALLYVGIGERARLIGSADELSPLDGTRRQYVPIEDVTTAPTDVVAPPVAKPVAPPEDDVPPPRIPAPPDGAEVVERQWEDLTFRFVRISNGNDFQGRLEIYVGVRLAYTLESYRFLFPDETEGRVPALGDDITGNDLPDFVIKEWTGGASCCFAYHVFEWHETEGELRAVATLDASHTELSAFRDVDGDGVYEFITNDWTFAEWRTDLAQSPAPQVILYYSSGDPAKDIPGGYRLALHIMRRDAPTAEQIEVAAKRVRELPGWKNGVPPVLWTEALKLIYTGNSELAWQFMRQAWPVHRADREAFVSEFAEQLRKSPHWDRLQSWSATPPAVEAVDTTSNMR